MRPAFDDGILQVTAAASLLDNSRLVEWRSAVAQFRPVVREAFEFCWRRDVDPVFGRLICWIMFSTGAEFLAKGVCLIRGVEIRTSQEVPMYPQSEIHKWVADFRKNWKSEGVVKTTHFGTLRNLTQDDQKTKVTAALIRLCAAVNASNEEQELLLAAYELLRKSVRNRDAHAYVPNVRDSHYSLVPELFSECFNLLVSWLPGGSQTLNTWRNDASSFVESL